MQNGFPQTVGKAVKISLYSNVKRILGNQYFNISLHSSLDFKIFINLSRENNTSWYDYHSMYRTKQAPNKYFGDVTKYFAVTMLIIAKKCKKNGNVSE